MSSAAVYFAVPCATHLPSDRDYDDVTLRATLFILHIYGFCSMCQPLAIPVIVIVIPTRKLKSIPGEVEKSGRYGGEEGSVR